MVATTTPPRSRAGAVKGCPSGRWCGRCWGGRGRGVARRVAARGRSSAGGGSATPAGGGSSTPGAAAARDGGPASRRSYAAASSPRRTGEAMGRRSDPGPGAAGATAAGGEAAGADPHAGASAASSCSTVRPQTRPWQMPRPARVASFMERRSVDDAARAVARIRPTGTSSQRHASVSSRSQPVQPGRIPCAASMRRPRHARRPAADRGGDGGVGRGSARGAVPRDLALRERLVHSPDARDLARREHARRPGALGGVDLDEAVGADAAARGDRQLEPGREPVAHAHGVHGDPPLGARIGAHEASRRCTVTASTRSVPCAATTALPVE
ncbi:hypothetical protein BC477_17365 [Clavibacter michiganensis subsp. michiganensis]|uniref:Uncharacterized protein n=1 Tax=Clavibacter michiganensis subsp. michiganensis TaxID=33013 RepID=A0A251XDB8_CLAMM|nr:hypothetical protein BC477_17365 [Clavibacter michiganensis subsp. michiganensis]OUE00325.1 hypothetical protein CMMCAS07_18140 [Clavibacter michiganensis subsp. michiganensis]